MRNHGTGYVNFCSVEAAIQARERYAGQKMSVLMPEATGPEGEKELQVTFTSAQQNARGRVGGKGKGGGMGGGFGGTQMQGGQFGGKGKGGFDGGRGKGGPLEPSRSVYVGSLPAGVTLAELSELAVPFGMLESLRWMGQPFAFLNFVELDHAVALWEAGQHGRGPGIWMRGQRLTINWG